MRAVLSNIWFLLFISGVTVPSAVAQAQESKGRSGTAQESGTSGPWRASEALGAPDWLLFHGSHRIRYSGLANQFRPGLDENDQSLSLRTLVTVGFTLKGFSAVGELQDSRAYLNDSNSALSSIVINAVEPLQVYLGYERDAAITEDDTLDIKLGRQTFDIGSRRLFARNRFRNTIQNFTGLTGKWRRKSGQEVFVMSTLPVSRRPGNSDRDALLDNKIELDDENLDLSVWGIFYQQPLPHSLKLQAYMFGLHEFDDDTRETRNRQLYTTGVRLFRKASTGDWDMDAEGIVQFGSRHLTSDPADTDELDVRAHFSHLSAGYTFAAPWSPRLSAEFDYASGDDDTTTGQYERFDSLFGPRRAEYGPTGIYGPLGRENTVSAGLRVKVKPLEWITGYVSWRANWLARSTDMFSRTGLRDPSGNSGLFAGHQIEFRTKIWLIPKSILIELGGAAFLEGAFMRDAPNSPNNGNPYFIYSDLEVFF